MPGGVMLWVYFEVHAEMAEYYCNAAKKEEILYCNARVYSSSYNGFVPAGSGLPPLQ